MRLLIDGDGCPDVKIMEEIAKKYNIPMYIYVDSSHDIYSDYAKVIILDTWEQSVDIQLVNMVISKDIVVTQDYGVAVISLSKGARVIHPKGVEYTDDTIMGLLVSKHQNHKLRKQNIRVKGPKKRTKEDTKELIHILVSLIMKERGEIDER